MFILLTTWPVTIMRKNSFGNGSGNDSEKVRRRVRGGVRGKVWGRVWGKVQRRVQEMVWGKAWGRVWRKVWGRFRESSPFMRLTKTTWQEEVQAWWGQFWQHIWLSWKCLTMFIKYIVGNFSDHLMWRQNWPHEVCTSTCQVLLLLTSWMDNCI